LVYWNIDDCSNGACYEMSAFSWDLTDLEPPYAFYSWLNCLRDDSLWTYSSTTDRLITDSAFLGIDDDATGSQTTSESGSETEATGVEADGDVLSDIPEVDQADSTSDAGTIDKAASAISR
jgi:hypothetical protein